MATFVLVHGAWSGGWVYATVARALRSHGHDVYTPTLTGLGERSHLAGVQVDLSLHIQDVANVFDYEDLSDVILVGHSYGGMVVTGVASRLGPRIRSLVYVDAFVPQDGQALWDFLDDAGRAGLIDRQRAHRGRVGPPSTPVADPAGREARSRKLGPQSLLCYTEPVALTGEEAAIMNRTYIYATLNAPTNFTRFYDRLRDDPTWKVRTVDCGHVVQMDAPEQLTALLLEEVGRQ